MVSPRTERCHVSEGLYRDVPRDFEMTGDRVSVYHEADSAKLSTERLVVRIDRI